LGPTRLVRIGVAECGRVLANTCGEEQDVEAPPSAPSGFGPKIVMLFLPELVIAISLLSLKIRREVVVR
jgi:hypothetical protein